MQNSAARSSIDVGSVVAGTYTIEALIGRGGMGAVFLASHNRLPGKKVAIKVLHAELDGEEVLARFNREAKIASLLSHPNIVHIEDYNVTADGMPYVVLEYLQGESLAQRLRNGPVSLDQTFSIIRQVASALAAAHGKGIVHRDLKPANIFLVPSEIDGVTREIAKVLDFGISKMRDGSTVKTQDSALLGTPQYMAPEQALGQHDKVDQRTDIFALGAIVYELLSGQAAFGGQTIPEVVFKVVYEQPVDIGTRVPSLPDTVKLAIQTAMSKNADERYPSVSAFIEALTGSPVSVMRVAKPPAPEVGFAAGSNLKAPASSADALAQTMDSGNHGKSPVPVVDGTAATIASQSGAPSPLSRTVTAADGAAATLAQAAPGPAKRGRAGFVIGGILLAAIAAGAVLFATRSSQKPTTVAGSREQTKARETPASELPPPPPPPGMQPTQPLRPDEPAAAGATPPSTATDTAPPSTGDTPPSATDTPPVAADVIVKAPTQDTRSDTKTPGKADSNTPGKTDSKTSGKTDSKAKPPVEVDDDTAADAGGDNTAAERLRAAEKAFRNGQWDATVSAANSVFGTEDARPKQRSRARVFHGIASCRKNDEEAARIDLRVLGRSPAMRQQLIAGCKAAGYDLR